MTSPDQIRVWSDGRAGAPEVETAGSGRSIALVRKNPDRQGDEPCEDAASLISWSGKCAVLTVADGLGGHDEGEVASQLTLKAIADRLRRADADTQTLQTAVLEAIDVANSRLVDRAGSAATTILVAAVGNGEFRSYHAGDSELLLVGQRGKVKHKTVSHSPVGYAVEAGVMDAKQGFEHADRHIISNCVGMVGMRVEMGSAIKMAARDTLVLASDGLWDNLQVSEVAEIVRKGPLERAACELEERSLMRMRGEDPKFTGKPDDLTVILYRPS